MLQYALLHLAGYALTIDDLKKFRVRLPPLSLALSLRLSLPLTHRSLEGGEGGVFFFYISSFYDVF